MPATAWLEPENQPAKFPLSSLRLQPIEILWRLRHPGKLDYELCSIRKNTGNAACFEKRLSNDV